MAVRPTFESEEVLTICADTGTGCGLIDRQFLQHFEHKLVTATGKDSGAVKGFGSGPVQLKQYTEFSFYANGTKLDGTHGVINKFATVWVVDRLDAGCLLGNGWLHPYDARVDLLDKHIKFPHDQFRIPFEINKSSSHRVISKVVNPAAVALKPGASMTVRVQYTPLPKDRSYTMTATHLAVTNALVDSKTPHVCLLTNPTNKTVKIPRKTRLATIHESVDQAYIVTDAVNAFKTLATAATLGASLAGMTPADRDSYSRPRLRPSTVDISLDLRER